MKDQLPKTAALRISIVVFVFLTLAHSIAVLAMPNGVEGSNWLGYSRSRFLVILGSLFLTIVPLWFYRKNNKTIELLERFVSRKNLVLGVSLVLGLVITVCFQTLTWRAHLLPNVLLVYRENFYFSILWLAATLCLLLILFVLWSAKSSKHFIVRGLMVFGSLAFLNLRILNALSFGYAGAEGDAVNYIGFENLETLFAGRYFWSGPRPFVLPLIGTLLGRDPYAFAWFQTILSCFAWVLLAYVVSQNAQSFFMKATSFIIVLVFSLSDRIFVWDWAIISESVTISLMVILIAGWIVLLRKWTWPLALLVVAAAFLWAFTRDINGWPLLLVAALIFVSTVSLKTKRNFLLIAFAFVAIFLLNVHSVNSSGTPRWMVPYMHVLAFDILPESEALAFFEKSGMPVPGELLSWAGRLPDYSTYYYADQFESFRNWLLSDGQATLGKYLLASMPDSLYSPLNSQNGFPIDFDTKFGRTSDYDSMLPDYLHRIVFFELRNPIIVFLLIAIVGYGLKRLWDTRASKWVVPLTLILLSYPYAFLAWHGDVLERSRHVLPADLMLRVGILILMLLVIEDIYYLRLAQRAHR